MRTFAARNHGNILSHQAQPQSPSDLDGTAEGNYFSQPQPQPLPPILTPPTSAERFLNQQRRGSPSQLQDYPESTLVEYREQKPVNVSLQLPSQLTKGLLGLGEKNKLHELQLQSFFERLTENERSQRSLATETTRLHGELNESFRFHDGILRDEVQTRRSMEEHFRFLRSVVQHLQDQTSAMSQQLTLEREAAFHSIELSKIRAGEQERFQEIVRQRSERDAERISALTVELSHSRQESAQLRAEMDARLSATADELRRLSQIAERADADARSCRQDLEALKVTVAQSEARFHGTMEMHQSKLEQNTKSLQEYVLSTKNAEDQQISQMKDELLAHSAKQEQQLSVTENAHQVEIHQKIDHILDTLRSQHDHLNDLSAQVDYKLETNAEAVTNQFRDILAKQKAQQLNELRETLKAIQALRIVGKSTREEERKARESLEADLRRTKLDIQSQNEELRKDIQAQLRKIAKPFIVL
ncbi:hypothetical protein DFS34DRAFT_247611 [Phlyctochytrium arcticum]|nr:hypothetical protein DFS34DRAFT_247611 [Phlyctochytrium arcticum]